MNKVLTAVACLGLIAGAAVANAAESAAAPNNQTPAYAAPVIADANAMRGADEMHGSSLRQQLQAQLSKAGFSDIKIMPSSFYVQAKDKKGEPVAMVIGPDSFAEVTEIPAKTQGAMAQQTPTAQAAPNAAPKQP